MLINIADITSNLENSPFWSVDEAIPEIWHTSLQYLPPYFLVSA